VTEAFNRQGELFGDDRLEALLAANLDADHKQIIKTILTSVAEYASGIPPSDDITMMAIRYHGR